MKTNMDALNEVFVDYIKERQAVWNSGKTITGGMVYSIVPEDEKGYHWKFSFVCSMEPIKDIDSIEQHDIELTGISLEITHEEKECREYYNLNDELPGIVVPYDIIAFIESNFKSVKYDPEPPPAPKPQGLPVKLPTRLSTSL